MKRWLVVAACAAWLTASSAMAAPADDLRQIIAGYERFSADLDPLRAAQRGDAAAAVRWPDDTPEAVATRRRALEDFSARLTRLANASLTENDALERDVLVDRVSTSLQGLAFDEERIPIITGEGFFANPDYAATFTAPRNEQEAEAWITRLEALPAYYDSEIVNMRRGVRTNFTQPRLVVEASLRGVRAQAAVPAAQSPLLGPMNRLPATIPAAKQTQLRQRATQVYEARVIPALTRFADFLEREYLPHARAQLGARSLPNGAAYYRYLVRRHTTTDMTPEQIHALGQREVARIRREMDAVIRETSFRGSFAEFLHFLRTDPQFYAHDADELMRITSEISNRANGALPHYFATLPRNTYVIAFIPEALEGGSAGYWPGNPVQGVAGQVLLRRTGAEQRTLYDLPSWVFHEGAPGHHIQIAIAEEQANLPSYRRNDDVTAFVEGWALYSERLGDEMGLYRTPYEKFGRLSMEMWRACRLVMDTGVHWMGWTRERARACLADNSALQPSQVEFETDRYIGWPGQALAYKLGEIEIRDIRANTERTLRACFDIRRFHDALLGAGPLPLRVLRQRMQRWTAAQSCPAR